jgi:hypothetical protein
MTTIKTTVVKSVHIEGCWPYQYVKPLAWHKRPQESKDRRNAKKREIYHAKKKLLGLRVYEMDIDICKELNNGTK